MSIHLLNNGAELCIKAMHMEKKDEDIARKCVSRYSRPETFYATMNWIIFRLENAVKSIFGKSEWQLTKNVIQNHVFKSAMEKVKAEKNISIDHPENEIKKLLNETVFKMTDIYVNSFFPMCLKINQKSPKITEELKEKIKKLDLINFLNENVIKSVDNIYQKALKQEIF